MELLISGFSIVLLLQGLDKTQAIKNFLQLNATGYATAPLFVLSFYLPVSAFILLINLIFHLCLRGLWIATIGLRSVSNKVEYSRLGYADRFRAHLLKKVGSYDDYIARLEQLCSSLFAFSFLLVFTILSVFIILSILTTLGLLIAYTSETNVLGIGVFLAVILAVLLIAILPLLLLYIIDFITLGGLKRIKKPWFSKFYLPVYRVLSALTLAPLYRPLLYNMLSNRFGKRLVLFAVPYLFLLLTFFTVRLEGHPYFPSFSSSNTDILTGTTVHADYYDNLRKDKDYIKVLSLPSKYVTNSYLEVFVHYLPSENKLINELLPDSAQLHSGIISKMFYARPYKDRQDYYLSIYQKTYNLYINDSLVSNSNAAWYTHPNMQEKGVLEVLDIAYLARGRHELKLEKLDDKLDEEKEPGYNTYVIPFWKE